MNYIKFETGWLKVLCVFFILLLSCNNSTTEKEPQLPGVYGKIRLLSETSYLLKNTDEGPKMERKARRQLDTDDFKAYFNYKGKLSKKVYYDSNGNELKKIIYTYNSRGNCSEQKNLDSEGNVYSIIGFQYDKRGYKISEIEMNSKKVVLKLYSYNYNDTGQLIKEIVNYSTGDRAYSRCFIYGVNGNLSEEQWFSKENVLYKKVKYKYNIQNFKEEEITELMDSNEIYTHWKFKYKYDSYGNWISRTDYLDNIPRYRLVRVIEYK